MNQVLQAPPRCEKHGCEKVWIKSTRYTAGGFYRCRECNNEARRRSHARQMADPAKRAYINAGQRKRRRKRLYGVDQAVYNSMLEKQGGCCAICGSTEVNSVASVHSEFFVDHDHKTGAVRGLLCHNCNVGLGNFQDSVGNLEKAIAYLNAGQVGAAP